MIEAVVYQNLAGRNVKEGLDRETHGLNLTFISIILEVHPYICVHNISGLTS